jgi:hypothetical protein
MSILGTAQDNEKVNLAMSFPSPCHSNSRPSTRLFQNRAQNRLLRGDSLRHR